MVINVKRCYFHCVQPLINYKLRKSHIDEVIARLDFMLGYGYLVPGRELCVILPEEYQEGNDSSFFNEDSVYLAQHRLTELESIGGSYINGEFSAYSHHIESNVALVFDEHVTEYKKIENRAHSLSEEVCIQQRISLKELIALVLPYKTPLDDMITFINWIEDDLYQLDRELFKSVIRRYKTKVENILNDPMKAVSESYENIKKFQDCLVNHQVELPCIRHSGVMFDQKEDYQFVKENENKIVQYIKKID